MNNVIKKYDNDVDLVMFVFNDFNFIKKFFNVNGGFVLENAIDIKFIGENYIRFAYRFNSNYEILEPFLKGSDGGKLLIIVQNKFKKIKKWFYSCNGKVCVKDFKI